MSDFDLDADPTEDFYQFVNGGWVDSVQIPKGSAGITRVTFLRSQINEELLSILEGPESSETSDFEKFLRSTYAAGMDISLAQASFQSLQHELVKIEEITNKKDLSYRIGFLQRWGVNSPFSLFVQPDAQNNRRHIGHLWQSGLSLYRVPLYSQSDARSIALRTSFEEHLIRVFELLGDSSDQANRKANAILQIEKELAAASNANRRSGGYNRMDIGELEKTAPQFDWQSYLDGLGIESLEDIIVGQPHFLRKVSQLTKSISLSSWKAYLSYHLIQNTVAMLPENLRKEINDFHLTTQRGINGGRTRQRQVIDELTNTLGNMMGRAYAKNFYPEKAASAMTEMVQLILKSAETSINELTWMSKSTKVNASKKLENMTYQIGQPERWTDYSSIKLNGIFLEDILAIRAFNHQIQIQRIGQNVDPNEWRVNAHVATGFYSRPRNQFTFPAGFLKKPYFDFEGHPALYFGATGVPIAHEIIHGFDNVGRSYDHNGELNDWWQPEDASIFQSRVQKIIAQFDGYTLMDSVHLNGRLVLDENIADLGGLSIAYRAFEAYMKEHPDLKGQAGFTPEQLFFIGYAKGHQAKISNSALIRAVETNPHAPPIWRVNGTLSNFQPFLDAFDVPRQAKMRLADSLRVAIW